MKTLLLAVLFCGIMNIGSGQDSLVQRFGIHFDYHPYDFFAGLRYERERGVFQQQFLLSAGVRALFQQRFYPQLGYQLGYHLLTNRWLQTGPMVRATASLLHVNRQASHGFVYDEELFLGAYIGTGNRNRFRLSAGIGPAVEQSWSPLSAHFEQYFSWNYFGEISYTHAF
jgi:hypothetical protein